MDAELARIVALAMGGAVGICAIIGWTVTNIARSRALGGARVASDPEDQQRVEDLEERVAELEERLDFTERLLGDKQRGESGR